MARPGRREPVWLTPQIVQALHSEQLAAFGGSAGDLKPDALEAVLARPRNRFLYDSEADLASLAASYLIGLVNGHVFVDGNKRVGLAAALVFLALNGRRLGAPPAELYPMIVGIATSRLDEPAVAAWLRQRLEAAP